MGMELVSTMTNASQRLDELEKLLEAGTAGEWFEDDRRVDGSSGHNDYYTVLYGPSGQILADTLNSDCVRLEDGGEGRFYDVVGQANLRAIAALKNDAAGLIACARALVKIAEHATGGVGANPEGLVQFARAAIKAMER